MAFIFVLLVAGVCVMTWALAESCSEPSSTPSYTPPPTPSYQLDLLSWNNTRGEYGYIYARGQVKNICSESLENVTAVVQYYTNDGTFVVSDSALIDYNPILPGQVSPFEVMTRDNPAIARGEISFKFLLGGSIPTR